MKTYILRFRQIDRVNFEEVRSGEKSIETRAATVKYRPIVVGDEIKFVCGDDSFVKMISNVYHWPSVDAMVKEIPFKKVMPSGESVAELKKAYASYPGYEEKIKEFGLLGFEFA